MSIEELRVDLHKVLGVTVLALWGVTFSITTQANWSLHTDVLSTKKADIKNSGGDELSTRSYDLSLSNKYVTVGYKRTDYDFSKEDAFNSLNKGYVDLRYNGPLGADLGYFVGLTAGLLFEEGASLSDSYSLAPRVGIGYSFNKDITAFFGATANINAAKNIYLPIIGLKVGDESDYGWSGALAYPETRLSYRFNQYVAVHGTFMTVRDIYHLDDSESKAEMRDGFFREDSYGLGVGATLTPMEHVKLSAGVFSYFDRSFKIYDQAGNEIDSFDADNAAGFYFRAGANF